MGGRLCEIPALYGYSVGGCTWFGREIRQALTRALISSLAQVR
jgi:hypothetical protein